MSLTWCCGCGPTGGDGSRSMSGTRKTAIRGNGQAGSGMLGSVVFTSTTQQQFTMYQDAVMVPTGDWAKKRLANLAAVDTVRYEASTNSNFGRNVSHWIGRNMVYPSNVLHTSAQTTNVGHPAAFPELLPEFFIQLFTKTGRHGSGSVLRLRHHMRRRCKARQEIHRHGNIAKILRHRKGPCRCVSGHAGRG